MPELSHIDPRSVALLVKTKAKGSSVCHSSCRIHSMVLKETSRSPRLGQSTIV